MSRIEDFDTATWTEDPFASLSAPAKLVFVWSRTNLGCGMAGLYRTRVAQIAFETGHSSEQVTAALAELAEHDLVYFDAATGVLWNVERARRLRRRFDRMARSVARDVAKIPADHPLRIRFLEVYAEQPWLRDELRPLKFDRTSGELLETPDSQGKSENFSGTSPDVPGEGEGINVSEKEGVQGPAAAPGARESRRRGVDHDELPADFPAHLAPVADQVLAGLRAIHERTCRDTSAAPTLHRVGLALTAFPHVDHVPAVHELEMWATNPARRRQIRDLAATYRTFLDRKARDAAARNGAERTMTHAGDLDRFERAPTRRTAAA